MKKEQIIAFAHDRRLNSMIWISSFHCSSVVLFGIVQEIIKTIVSRRVKGHCDIAGRCIAHFALELLAKFAVASEDQMVVKHIEMVSPTLANSIGGLSLAT